MLEMIHHLLPTSSSIFTSIIILVLATVHIPTSFSQDDQRFVACGEPFQCGTVRDITYPFWGENRRAYCGHPSFPLTCQSGVPLLTIQSLLYRILSINPSSQVLTVARDDLWSTDCPESLHNTTLDFCIFNYAFGVENITLHYDCPVLPGSALIPNQFDCNNNESSRTNIFARTDTPTIGNFNVPLCQDQIIVPVNSTSAQAIGSLPASVSDLRAGITAGFGLQWIANNTACNNCIQSGGRCGYNSTTSSFACFCSDQPYAQTCNGLGSGPGGLFMIMGAWWLRKIIKRRNKAKLKMKFFKRNGGLLLQKQLCSAEQVYVEKTKLFSSKELETATDHYNENRVLGRGGQGTVYKGMLTDGKIVAVKKSKIVDEGKLDEFINEVVILSQINHRNVVKLHGCCLETEVPLLVYDFIPNGTLFQYIHHQENKDFPLTWDVRLRIASEVAGALFYLHSAASLPIYHRDIKSSNILLDDKYRAKVADFGTSRSAAVEQTHMTTRVQGTFGYLDPEYYQSSQFTAKSDVYSFGVVLVELLTGQKAILPITFMEGRSLATYFMLSIKENHLFDVVMYLMYPSKKQAFRFDFVSYFEVF